MRELWRSCAGWGRILSGCTALCLERFIIFRSDCDEWHFSRALFSNERAAGIPLLDERRPVIGPRALGGYRGDAFLRRALFRRRNRPEIGARNFADEDQQVSLLADSFVGGRRACGLLRAAAVQAGRGDTRVGIPFATEVLGPRACARGCARGD